MAANLLSILRVLLLPFLLYSLRQDGGYTSTTTVFLLLIAALTDLGDGYIARRFRQISRIGKILDPLADKIFLAGLITALVLWRGFPLWLLVILIGRDVGIMLAAFFLLRTRDLVIPANKFGKCTTVCLGFAALSFIFAAPPALKTSLVYATVLLLVVSTLSYTRLLIQILRSSERP